MQRWIVIIAGAIVLFLFAGKTFARVPREEYGSLFFDPNIEGEIDVTPASWFSDAAVENIKREEGFSLTAYRDAAGWSIGYGHYLGTEKTVEKITQDEADTYLANDIANAAQMILDHVQVPLSQNQFDALTSFVYNLGPQAFKSNGGPSTWLTMLNGGDYEGAATQLLRWSNSEGRHNAVLAQRREREKELFLSA